MQVIAHNMLAQFTNRQLNITSSGKSKSTEKLSSGYRINRAADDAAGLSISEKMRWQIRGLNRGRDNTQDGISWLQVADGSMEEIGKMIHRIRELSVQASNDTNTVSDRAAIDNEVSQLKHEINEICRNAEFNTQDIFDNITPAVKYRRFYLLKFPSAVLSSIVVTLATTHSSALQMKIYSS